MYQYGNVALKYQNKRSANELRFVKQVGHVAVKEQELVKTGLSTGEKLLYIFAILLVVGSLSVILMGKAAISQLNYEIQFLEKEIAQIKDMNAMLQLEVAALSSPDRIIGIATSELGLNQEKSTVRILSHREDHHSHTSASR